MSDVSAKRAEWLAKHNFRNKAEDAYTGLERRESDYD